MNMHSLKILVPSLILSMSAVVARADLSYSNAVAALGPVAYWPLQETNQPPSNFATNLGTAGAAFNGYYGSAVTLGAAGALVGSSDTAATFAGNSDVDIPFAPALGVKGPFTVELWVNSGGSSAQGCVISDGNFNSPRAGWLLYNNVGNTWDFRLYNQNGTATSLDIGGGATDSNWHHIAAVFDGTNGTLYIDGAVAAGPTAATGYVPNPDTDLTIGERSLGDFQFTGSIDEVAIYTNAISAADITAHYQNGISASPAQTYSSLVLADHPEFYYRLDETIAASTATATNYGNIGATVNGTYLPGSQPGVAGPNGAGFGAKSMACAFLPVAGGHVDCTTDASLDITGPMTVVAWVKGAPADTGARFQSFLGRSDSSWRADFGTPGVPPDGAARFADGGNPDCAGQTFINDGNWHFFTGIYDGAATYVYIDGVLDGTNTAAGVGGDPAADMVIGGVGDYVPGRLFKGSVAQVAVFTNALTANQVQSLYLAGELAPTIDTQPVGFTIGLGDGASLTAKVTGNPTLVYQWYNGTTKVSDVSGNISGSTTSTLTFANAQVSNGGNYTLVVSNNFGAVTSSVAVVTITPSPAVATQPQATTLVYAGNKFVLNVSAVGATPLSYQWYNGTTPIGGATSTNVTITALAGTNSYYVIITNSFGAATSHLAQVDAQTFVMPAGGFVVNFDAYDGTLADNFHGQGAYADVGNDVWNPIGDSGTTTGLAFNSASNQTLVTATLIYGFNNSGIGIGAQKNGDPSWLLSTEDAVNGGSPGIGTSANPMGQLTINNLPQGKYTLYLYAQNYDGTRGAIFTIDATNGGFADGGTNYTDPASQAGFDGSDITTYVEGQTYCFFTNVVTDPSGAIRLTYVYNNLDPQLLTGEAPFSGIQVIANSVSTPTILSILPSGPNAVISWAPAGGTLQSATSIAGPFTAIPGATSPYTNGISAPKQFYRVLVQ